MCFKVQSAAAALSAAPAHNSSLYVQIFLFLFFLLFFLLVLHVQTSIFKQTLPRSSLPPNPAKEEKIEEAESAPAALVADVTATIVGKQVFFLTP